MAKLSTLRVGGPAEAVIYPESEGGLVGLIAALQENAVPWLVIGRGSNILASDAGVAGVVIVLGRDFGGIRELSPGKIIVEAGCSLAKLTSWCAKRGLTGLEFAVGIPGSIGGAVKMNAGAWGMAISDVIEAVRLLNICRDGSEDESKVKVIPLTKSDFTYRAWRRSANGIITAAVFRLEKGLPEDILERGQELLQQRQAKQPKGVASAGSFFKNPPGKAAGRLIEKAGLKGVAIGGAMVSEVHANFLVNTGGAKAGDFVELMHLVQEKVLEKFAVKLEPEVKFM
jgi:UDP-N-acetylmuramate dehydrogenase